MRLPSCPIKNKQIWAFFFNPGFTLIELLVAVALVGVIITIGIASYNKFNEKQEVKTAVEEIKSYVRLAQSKAINNEKDCGACQGVDGVCATSDDLALTGWYLNLSAPRIYGVCDGVEFGGEQFLSGSEVSIEVDDLEILFLPLGQGTDLVNDLEITVSKGDEEATFILDPSGNILRGEE